jgi:hypothetical protein
MESDAGGRKQRRYTVSKKHSRDIHEDGGFWCSGDWVTIRQFEMEVVREDPSR